MSLSSLAKGRATQAANRRAGKPRNHKPTLWDTTEADVRPSAGALFRCPKCGEVLTSPSPLYDCPANKPGWIEVRGAR